MVGSSWKNRWSTDQATAWSIDLNGQIGEMPPNAPHRRPSFILESFCFFLSENTTFLAVNFYRFWTLLASLLIYKNSYKCEMQFRFVLRLWFKGSLTMSYDFDRIALNPFRSIEIGCACPKDFTDDCRQVSRNFTIQVFSIGTFLPLDIDQYRLLLFISLLTWHSTHLQDTLLMTQHKEKVTIYLSNRCHHCVFLRAYSSHGTAWINSSTSVDNFEMTEINVFLLRRHRILVSSCMHAPNHNSWHGWLSLVVHDSPLLVRLSLI